jgi:hypothetical protein
MLPNSTTYQRYYHFAVRVCLVVVTHFGLFPQNSVVVDLTIDRKGEGAFGIDDRLRAGVWPLVSDCFRRRRRYNTDADDTEAFMDKDYGEG